ncbi:MAG: hypothetical protein IT371_16660 [Deltaproteobacteria bacterium]|nr:hypothetical protein [Deltaproteobacteria bacterium]
MTRTTNRWMLLASLFALCSAPRAWADGSRAPQDAVQQLELGLPQAGWQEGAGQSDLLPVAARRPSGIQAALVDFAEAHRLSVELAVDKRCDRRIGHRVGRLVVGGVLNNLFDTAAYGLVAAIGSSALTVNPLAIPLGILASQAMIKYPSVGTQLATYIGWRRDGSERGGIGGLFRGYVGLTRGVHLLSVAGCNVVANVFRRVQGKETKSLTQVVGGWRAQTKELRPAAQPR